VRVLGISSSPRKKGFTSLLLDSALDGARAEGGLTDKVILNDLNFKPCQECGGCDKTGECVLNDDMTALYEKLSAADIFIVASPIYFGTITAQLKMMIDRCQSLWVKKYILKKSIAAGKKRKGVFICAAGKDHKEYFEDAKKVIKIFFTTLDIEYSGELFVGGLNEMTDNSTKKKDALLKSYELGMALIKS
jgi:multimeric flavodoxin WrbA